MKKALAFVGATLGMLACGGEGADMASQLLDDAGEMIADAGEAMQDAAAALDDAGEADAQEADSAVPQPPKGPEVLEAACDQVRVLSGTGTTGTQKWAKVPTDFARVRHVWACAPEKPTGCPGSMCSGATIPEAECAPPVYHFAQGSVWVFCGAYTKARVVVD
jgi:hypothetical protein